MNSKSGLWDGVSVAELVLPSTMMPRIRACLLSDLAREYTCQVLCGSVRIGDRLRLLGAYLVEPQPEDYLRQTYASLELRREYDTSLRSECADQGLHLIDFHSHPFSHEQVAFSGVDDADELDKAAWFAKNIPGSLYGSVVMGTGSYAARLFLPRDNGSSSTVPLELRPLEVPLPVRGGRAANDSPDLRFDRQLRAFGSEGQARLGAGRVAIVGVGGLGSLLAHGLCRLGVSRLTLIDPDRAEETNLNRLAGLTAGLARRRLKKVGLLARRLRTIRPEIEVEAIAADIFEPASWRSLRDVDVVVAATDNHATRMLLNQVCLQFLIPLVSCGVQIQTIDGRFDDAYGEIYSLVPGQPGPCLICSEAIDLREAYYELGSEENRREAARRGYISDFNEPAPAVYHLNGIISNLALAEIHNLLCGFMPSQPHIHYRMSQRRVTPLIHRPDKRCAICAPNGGSFARGDAIDPVPRLFPRVDRSTA